MLFIEFSNILPKDTLGLNYATAVAQNKHVAAAAAAAKTKTTKTTTTKKIVTQISAFFKSEIVSNYILIITHHVTQKFPQWLQEMVDIVKYMSSICLSTAKYKENKYIINGHNFIDIVKIIAHLALGTMFFTVHWLAILEQLLLLETFGA